MDVEKNEGNDEIEDIAVEDAKEEITKEDMSVDKFVGNLWWRRYDFDGLNPMREKEGSKVCLTKEVGLWHVESHEEEEKDRER